MQKKCFQTNRRLPYLLQIYNFCGWRMAKIEVQCVFLEMEHCAFPVFANDLLLQCTLYCLIHMPANSNQFSSSNKDVLGCGYAQTSCTSCVSWFELVSCVSWVELRELHSLSNVSWFKNLKPIALRNYPWKIYMLRMAKCVINKLCPNKLHRLCESRWVAWVGLSCVSFFFISAWQIWAWMQESVDGAINTSK